MRSAAVPAAPFVLNLNLAQAILSFWAIHAASQKVRKRVEEIFGWFKTVANFRRTRYRGVERTSIAAYLVAAAYNLLRIAKLCPTG